MTHYFYFKWRATTWIHFMEFLL